MPFTNNRIYYIAIIVVVIFFIGIIAANQPAKQAVNQPTPTPTSTPQDSSTITLTIKNNIGISQVEVQNLNTGKTFIFSLISLPAQFTCTRGDYLQFRVSTNEGYRWNAWWFSPMQTFNNDNPAIICADGIIVYRNQIVLTPNTLILPQTTVAPNVEGD